MDWLEFNVETDAGSADAVVELLNRFGQGQAVVEVPVDCFEHELETLSPPAWVVVRAYLPMDGSAEDGRRRLEEGIWHLQQIDPNIQLTIRELAEADWAEAWKQQYHRLRIGQRIVIVPEWEGYDAQPGEVVIRLEPGMAFGTGLHPTTRLCLRALEECMVPGSTVLDVGTGSGVLAIAAAKLGARSVLAIDADATAVKVAGENIERNGVADRVCVQHGTLAGGAFRGESREFALDPRLQALDSGSYDLVLINILAPVIVGMAPALAARLEYQGTLIAAGLVESQVADVTSALLSQGLQIVDHAREEDWVALVARGE